MSELTAMRVLMVLPKYPYPVAGGLERQAHELSRALLRRGHSVIAVSAKFDRTQRDQEEVDGITVHRMPWFESKWKRFLTMPWGLFRTLSDLKTGIDVVHVHNISWFGAFATVLAKWFKLPVLTKLPNFGAFGIPAEQARRFGRLRIALLRMSDAMVAMAPESLKELQAINYPSNRVLQATNGIALTPECPVRQDTRESTVVVGFVGRLSPEKGLVDLLHAWATLQGASSIPAVLRLVGDGPDRSQLEHLAAELEIAKTVEFVGHSGDVPGELARMDIFVLPSYAEGNSNAVLEAMRAGLPIIATRVGGTTIQVGGEGSRFLLTAGDREALAGHLNVLLRNANLRREAGQAMRARVEQIFSIDVVANIYERAYELLASGDSSRIGEGNVLFKQQCHGH